MNKQIFIAGILTETISSQLQLFPKYTEVEILKTVCAFLNTDGGWIILGFENKEAVCGLNGEGEKIVKDLEAAVSNRISPQPLVYAKCEKYKGHQVVLVNIMKGARQPYSFDGKYYIRDKNHSKIADNNDINYLLRNATEAISAWEKLTTIDASLEDIELNEVSKTINFANEIGKGEKLPQDIEGFLNYFKLIEDISIKNGSIVLFGRNPNHFLPQIKIRITFMPEGKTGNFYGDSRSIEDNLFVSFEKLQEYFKTTFPIVSNFSTKHWDRKDQFLIPMEALDEALVNAMVHRDYGDYAGEITINIFSDRMEIINSGEIPNSIIKGKNKIEAHHSILRNPTIAHIFYLRGKMEKLGRGLHLIVNKCSESGLKKPEWRTKNGYTTLTMFFTSEEININSRMQNFLGSIKENQEFTREYYESFFDNSISEKTARNDLSKLVLGQWILKQGDGPSTIYIRTHKNLPEITG